MFDMLDNPEYLRFSFHILKGKTYALDHLLNHSANANTSSNNHHVVTVGYISI